jgi:hypothetical protein
MAHDPATAPPAGIGRFRSPWFVVIAGLGCNLLSYLLKSVDAVPVLLRLGLLALGTFLLFNGVVRRLQTTGWNVHERLESAAMVSLAGLGALFGYLAMDKAWDSGHEFFISVFILTLCGALTIVLPPLARQGAISLMLLFHFAGIGVAITSIDPPGGTSPFVPKQLWTLVYRPYLTFMYMTNAYHFYSPDPGPPSLFWFAIQYSDGSYTWVKLPDRENSPIGMHYQRMLALPEHSFQPLPRLPLSSYEYQVTGLKPPLRGSWEMIYARREAGSMRLYRYPNPPKELKDPAPGYPIPMVPVSSIDIIAQYREPTDVHKRILAGIAKRVLWRAPTGPDGTTAQSVKLYRIVHQILSPKDLADGVSPMEKTYYAPYFMGEFDRDGRLKDELDPFLYWYLPITMVPPDYPKPEVTDLLQRPGVPVVYVGLKPKGGFLLDCLEMHAAGRIVTDPQEKK